MIPVRDVVPSRTKPAVTLLVLATVAIVYLLGLGLTGRGRMHLLLTYGLVPAWFEWRSLLLAPFLHAGWLTLLVNMMFLWIFAGTVEDRLGHLRFAAFYLLCGAAAGLGEVAASPSSGVPIVGAGGAIAGVMGAYFVLFPGSRVLTLVPSPSLFDLIEIPALYFLAIWIVLQLVTGIGTVGHAGGQLPLWGQVAGFATGAALVLVLRRRERLTVEWIE